MFNSSKQAFVAIEIILLNKIGGVIMKLKSVVVFALSVAMAASVIGCASKIAVPQASSLGTNKDLPASVTLNITTFRVGTHNAAVAETRYFKEFQEYYNGVDRQKIILNVEEMPSDSEYYNQLKTRASSNTLPDVFEGNGGVLELAVQNKIAVDMRKYVDADPQYKAELGEGAIADGSKWDDGGLYNISYGLQAIGYFYNKEMYEKAGITVPKTWDEWMSNLEKLKTSGVCKAPISLMTGENGWTTNLVLASIVGTSGEAGNKFMTTKYVKTFTAPEFVNALEKVQTMLQKYALPDAVGSDYATAANHFLNKETAIFPNGPWMTPDFSNPEKAAAGFANKVGIALYPEDGSISQFERGYSIAKSTSEKEDAAFNFIRFKTNAYGQKIHLEDAGVLPLTSKIEMSAELKEKNPLLVEFVGLLGNIKYKYQTIDVVSYPTSMNAMTTLYPKLADGSLSAQAMAKQLDLEAKKDAGYVIK